MSAFAGASALIVALILALAALLASWRSARRNGSWRRAQVWAQAPAAALLYLALFPPSLPLREQALSVLVPGVTQQQRDQLPWNQAAVALSEVEPALISSGMDRAPDLAAALRKNPATNRIEIIGAGLPARDRDAASNVQLSFRPAPEQGLLELTAPMERLLGTQWPLQGRVGADVARVELRDPSGALVDSAAPDGDRHFQLSAIARGLGESVFELRALDAKASVVDHASVPLHVNGGGSLSVIVRAGAPDPDLKYWRRWAADAGLSVHAAAALSDAIALRDGDSRLSATALAQTDLVILDERAWAALGADEKAALQTAVADGLGLLLRATGPVEPAVASDWAQWGYSVSADESANSVFLDRALGLHERAAFTRAAVAVDAKTAVVMLAADDGTPLAWWRAQGRGRVGLWRLLDSYRLQLIGEPGRYGGLWAQTLAALARAQPQAQLAALPSLNWVDQRSVLCGLGPAAQVSAADGARIDLLVDAKGCAAYWPAVAGWQQVLSGAVERPLYVRAENDGRGLRRTQDRNWTAAQAALSARASNPIAQLQTDTPERAHRAALPRWPLFLTWLLLTAGIWLREKQTASAL